MPEPPYDASPVTRAILEGGYVWETEVVERRARQRVRVNRSQPAKRLRERVFEADETIEQLQGMSDGEYLYQATLVAPPSLYQEYRLDPQLVRLASCRPDLLQCIVGPDGQRRMRVHDVKASTGVKLSHRIQVSLYTMILDHVVRGLAADVTADLEEGGVWLHGQDSPETFRLQLVLPYLKALLEDDLPRVLGAPPDHAEWHLNYRCEWCEYFDYCFEEALKTKSVSLLPYLSTPARRHLRANGVDALDDLATLLEQPGVESMLAASASLAGRRARLQLEVASLQNTSAMAYGSTAIAMPVHEDIVLLLTLQREPVSGLIYAAAFLRRGGAGVFGDNQDEAQFVAERPDRSEETCRRFIQALHKLLLAVHEYNASREWREQLGLQAYVFDSYERDLLRIPAKTTTRYDPFRPPVTIETDHSLRFKATTHYDGIRPPSFVAVLGASSYAYAEAYMDQTLPCWISAHTRAVEQFAGVPEVVVPDQPRTGVKEPCYYEPELNPTYQEWAEHYGTVVSRPDPRSPRQSEGRGREYCR